ncbi:MAG TPA: NUDIX domain-containing protein [Polyangiaceae bacterium]|nr:NUDIX domain-containing protein [Polyangiaceae bacterium]
MPRCATAPLRMPTRAGLEVTAGPADMLVDAVDGDDRVIGAVARRDVTTIGANFRVVHVLVFNSHGELLVQHIAPGLRHGGSWGSSAAGFVQAGEAYEAAATRKLAAELGANPPIRSIGRTSMLEGASTKFIGVFEATHDGPFFVESSSASEVEFLALPIIMNHRQAGTRVFTRTFLAVLDFYSQRVPRP